MNDTPTATESILDSIKSLLNIALDDTAFDVELIIYINAALEILEQLIEDQDEHLVITDRNDCWDDFFTETVSELAKMVVYLRVKLIFDPPATSTAASAMKELCSEYEWRVMINRGES